MPGAATLISPSPLCFFGTEDLGILASLLCLSVLRNGIALDRSSGPKMFALIISSFQKLSARETFFDRCPSESFRDFLPLAPPTACVSERDGFLTFYSKETLLLCCCCCCCCCVAVVIAAAAAAAAGQLLRHFGVLSMGPRYEWGQDFYA